MGWKDYGPLGYAYGAAKGVYKGGKYISEKRKESKKNKKLEDLEARQLEVEEKKLEVEEKNIRRESSEDIASKIETIKQLFDDGILTEEEYQKKKEELVSQI